MSSLENIELKVPSLEEGMAVYRLVAQCPPLDANSSYCNLLQCSHFADTSVAAKLSNELVGFISGYVIAQRPDTLFVWQVAVAESVRGKGVAQRMLAHILARSQCRDIRFIETSITENNQASWALFKSMAKQLSAQMQSSPWMDKDAHFDGLHESEALVRIGPFQSHCETKRGEAV